MRIVVGLLMLASMNSYAEMSPATMGDYTTCAVYHRMIAGGFQRSGRDMQEMANLEHEKMELMVEKAKELAREESLEEAEEIFLDEWQFVLADMTDQINRNYENVLRLKYRYRSRCTALYKTLNQ